jgi:hypothetical protein
MAAFFINGGEQAEMVLYKRPVNATFIEESK